MQDLDPALLPTIFFEDNHLTVLSKPAGLLSQGEHTGQANLVDWLRGHFGRHYVGLIHRLDRNTSGLMVVAKRTKAAQRLSESLQKGNLKRSYLAWVLGKNFPEKVRWEHWLLKDPKTNQVRVVKDPAATQGKPQLALLTAHRISLGNWQGTPVCLVEFELETGRSHQIRAQSSHEGFPLLGDGKYGGPAGFPRPALHSHKLTFPHPMSKEVMEFEAPLPGDMAEIASPLPAARQAPDPPPESD